MIPAATYTTPREYLDAAMKLIDEVPDLAEPAMTLERIGLAIDTDALVADVDGLRLAEKNLREVHCLIDNYLAESAADDVAALADLVLDADRGLIDWSAVIELARRLA